MEAAYNAIQSILTNVLTALYEPFWFAIIFSFVFMFFYMHVKENGWEESIKKWRDMFKSSIIFRKIFCLVFYTIMILFRTLLNRNPWLNPLNHVMGVWGLYNSKGEFTTEIIENFILFIPFILLLFWTIKNDVLDEKVKLGNIVWISFRVTLCFSMIIEFLQLFLRVGSFQLSDLFFNTLGGSFGGLIYWCGYRLTRR